MINNEELEIKDKERLLELFNSILNLFDANHNLGNNFLTGELNLSEFERKIILVGKYLDKEENFDLKKKLNHLQYSHGLKENYYYNPLLDIFKEIHQEPEGSENLLNVFIEKLEVYLETIRDTPLSEYTLIFPINLNFKDGIPIQFLQNNNDVNIKLVPYSEFSHHLELIMEYITSKYGERREFRPNYAQEEIDLIHKCNHRDNSFFIVRVHARNVSFAVKKVVEDVEINAGLYTLANYYRRVVKRFGGGPLEKSIGNIKMPLVYVFINNQIDHILFSTYELHLPRSTKSINFNKLNFITSLLSVIHQFKSEKLKHLIYHALAQYYIALKTSQYSVSF